MRDSRYRQEKSMAKKYMNRFAIEEDDQFEIHVKDYNNKTSGDILKGEDKTLEGEDIYNAAEEVMCKAQQGKGCYCLQIKIY